MRQFNSTDRRALVIATFLLGLGTVVRVALAPDTAEIAWRPATAERAAETLGQVRRNVDEALDREAEAARPLGPQERIDINNADETALRRLPGVGPSRAAAILRDRNSRGPFGSLQDLSRVPGIGKGLIERLSPHVDDVSGAEMSSTRLTSRGIDLNRAQITELEQITGIGPALAARIVGYRARNGGFETVDDLLRVPGIGPKKLEMLRDEVFAH
jgi:competence protein ComEA